MQRGRLWLAGRPLYRPRADVTAPAGMAGSGGKHAIWRKTARIDHWNFVVELPASLKSAVERLLENQPLEPLMKAAERGCPAAIAVRCGMGSCILATIWPPRPIWPPPARDLCRRARRLGSRCGKPQRFCAEDAAGCRLRPGTALWATSDCWDGLERQPWWRQARPFAKSEKLSPPPCLFACDWRAGDITRDCQPCPQRSRHAGLCAR